MLSDCFCGVRKCGCMTTNIAVIETRLRLYLCYLTSLFFPLLHTTCSYRPMQYDFIIKCVSQKTPFSLMCY